MGNLGFPFHVPEGITIDILRLLPVKSLVRFRCVCKSWTDLIMSDQFRRCRTICFRNEDPGLYTKSKLERLRKLKLSETMQIGSRNIILGHCNGIICLWDSRTKYILLWNPATNQCRVLPRRESKGFQMGLGYDSTTQDYKVVTFPTNSRGVVEVYSLKSNSWKQIQFSNLRFLQPGFRWNHRAYGGCFCKGRLHWIIHCSVYYGGRIIELLVVFDLNNEELLEFEIPESISEILNRARGRLSYNFGVFNGHLSLLTRSTGGEYYEIWSMQDHSWTIACQLPADDIGDFGGRFTYIVGLTEGGVVWVLVYYGVDDRVVYLYDIQVNNRLKLQKRVVNACRGYKHPTVLHYLETFVSVESETRLGGAAEKWMRSY